MSLRQASRSRWISDFKAILHYKVCSRLMRATQQKPISKGEEKERGVVGGEQSESTENNQASLILHAFQFYLYLVTMS